jgi:aryl-alcohol dehydrogenase-like predicted oxidoreductase
MSAVEHLRENLGALDVALSPDQLARLDALGSSEAPA